MGKLICDLCEGNNLVKEGEYIVCQDCGCKYTLEEARKMISNGNYAPACMDQTITESAKVQKQQSELDNTVDKMIQNAYSTLKAGYYQDAFNLYTNILNLDPNNAHACLYRGFASAWQSTVNNCRIFDVNNAAKQAFQSEYQKTGSSKAYFQFANQAAADLTYLLNAMEQLYIKEYNSKMGAELIYTVKGLGRGFLDSMIYSHGEKTDMQNGVENCCKVSYNFTHYILDNVSDFTETFDMFWNNMRLLINNAIVYRQHANLKQDPELDSRLREIQRIRANADKNQKESSIIKIKPGELNSTNEIEDEIRIVTEYIGNDRLVCPYCGKSQIKTRHSCYNCGKAFVHNMDGAVGFKTCSNCGKQNEDDAYFCEKCGSKL